MLSPEVERSDALDEAQAVLAAARRTARTNGLMSAAALLFSGCALAVSLSLNATAGSSDGVPSALLPERAAAKALQPETHYVRLEELAIYRDQIVAGAVGTEELSDASVNSGPARMQPVRLCAHRSVTPSPRVRRSPRTSSPQAP